MKRTFATIALGGLLALALAAPALAAGPSPGSSENVYLTGHNETFNAALNMGLIGIGYRYNLMPQGGSWAYTGAFEYSMGKLKHEHSGLTSYTDEIDASQWAIDVGMSHWYDCCDNAFYCGPDLYYSNTTLTNKTTGQPDDKLKGFATFGLGGHFGGSFPLGNNLRGFGEMRDILGYSSYDQTQGGEEDKWTNWSFIPSYRGGLQVTFGKH